MGSRRISLFLLSSVAVAVLARARAEEPSARELIALAPVLDSSDAGCRSLDVGGWLGYDGALAPKLSFRALYRAPNQFALLISDAADGTPLAFCSGRKIFVYDPVGPTVYYSEEAGFTLEITCTNTGVKFGLSSLLYDRSPQHILVDFRSVLSFTGRGAVGAALADGVVKRNINEFEFIRMFQGKPYLTINIDLTKTCPYTEAAFVRDGITFLRLDRLTFNGALGDEPFAFPARLRLTRALPVKNVTADKQITAFPSVAAVLERATLVRAVISRAGPPGPIDIPGLSGVNWDRVRENDKKFARAIRDLVPPSLRAR